MRRCERRLISWVAWTIVAAVLFPRMAAAQRQADLTALDRYVAKEDPSYRWKVVHKVAGPGMTTWVIDMTSQTWRTTAEVNRTEWQHWLVVVQPDGAKFDTALLFIGGGSNGGAPPAGADERTMKLAEVSKSVVATLSMVPNQPLEFHGDGQPRKEDDLVGYTWDQFLKTGDPTWPARNPMVKSAVRAMDTITALLAGPEAGGLRVDKFVVAGGSKRGWTTWLTGVVDRRVVAIVPIVIDVLNVEQSMRHHFAAYGFWAPAVGNYVQHKIFPRMGTQGMKDLEKLVDPLAYRQRLTMPKYIMNAAGDQFFVPDSWQFYYYQLLGEKYLRYVPNGDHSLNGTAAVENLLAFYLTVLHNESRPQFTWTCEDDGGLRVTTKEQPTRVLLWQATNPEARDFRVETLGRAYSSSELQPVEPGVYVGRVAPPAKGWTAYFVELTYDIGEPVPFQATTGVRIVPDVLPFADQDPREGKLGAVE